MGHTAWGSRLMPLDEVSTSVLAFQGCHLLALPVSKQLLSTFIPSGHTNGKTFSSKPQNLVIRLGVSKPLWITSTNQRHLFLRLLIVNHSQSLQYLVVIWSILREPPYTLVLLLSMPHCLSSVSQVSWAKHQPLMLLQRTHL